jgi:hypothetical protein
MADSDAPKNDPAMLAQFEYPRRLLDFYPTPTRCTEALLKSVGDDLMPYAGWEPAAGTGAISNVVKDHFREFVSTDLVPYDGFDCQGHMDFLKCDSLDAIENIAGFRPDCIITNPPYGKLAEAFVRKSLKLMEDQRGLVISLHRHEWDTAKNRADLFDHPAFAMKLTLCGSALAGSKGLKARPDSILRGSSGTLLSLPLPSRKFSTLTESLYLSRLLRRGYPDMKRPLTESLYLTRRPFRAFYDEASGIQWHEINPDGTPGEPVTRRDFGQIASVFTEAIYAGDAWVADFFSTLKANGKANLRGA